MLATALAAALVQALAPPAPAAPHLPPTRTAAAPASPVRAAEQAPWRALEPGLEVVDLEGPPADSGDRTITIVRIDPARFELRLLTASAPAEGTTRTARAWAYHAGASAAINAAMYQEDYRTSVSLLRSREHVNQRRISKDKAVLAFDPLVSGVPPVRIVDRECESLDGRRRAVRDARAVDPDGVVRPAERLGALGAAVLGGGDRRGPSRPRALHPRAHAPGPSTSS